MPTRTELAQIALDAKNDGATHVIIARRPTTALDLDPDNTIPSTGGSVWNRRSSQNHDGHYAVPVYPGHDASEVAQGHARPVYCLALQHPGLSLRDQIAEHQPWHPDPVPGLSDEDLARLAPPAPATRRDHVPFRRGATADADARAALRLLAHASATPASEAARPHRLVTVEELEAATANVSLARSWTFSTQNTRADYAPYESARKRLVELTHAAYEQGRIGPYNVHRITGLHREDTAPTRPAPGPTSHNAPLGVPAVISY